MSVTLARRVRGGVETGEPLPDAYKVLAAAGIRFRRGNLHLVAGQTGSMKTMWLLDMVKRMNVPTLYLSNDSDEATIAERLLASALQRTTEEVAADMAAMPSWAGSILAQHDNIRWSFDPGPTLDDIDLEMEAFAEVYGDYPQVLVVDVLKNVSYYEEKDAGSYARVLQFLHTSARTTGTCAIVVHHCAEGARAEPCPPRASVLQKQNELPVLITTVAVHGSYFYVAPVKNRHGSQDPTGSTAYRLRVDPQTCTFWET